MFNDTPQGATHSENDGCGEPEHNQHLPTCAGYTHDACDCEAEKIPDSTEICGICDKPIERGTTYYRLHASCRSLEKENIRAEALQEVREMVEKADILGELERPNPSILIARNKICSLLQALEEQVRSDYKH